jgi:hypothetical protein
MAESLQERYERLQVTWVLEQHRGLRIAATDGHDLTLRGSLAFRVTGPDGEMIDDAYDVEICVPLHFPRLLPRVKETGGRIPRHYHKLEGNLLCLGAPTALRMEFTLSPTLPTIVNRFVIAYLYGYSYYTRHGRTPFGELAHGDEGIRQNLVEIFAARTATQPEEFLRLAGMKRREANKHPCACGSGRRLGRCHNRRVNQLSITALDVQTDCRASNASAVSLFTRP